MSVVGLKDKLDKIWRWVIDEHVGMIGIYGMGGVGKTTLMRLIRDKLLESCSASTTIIWVTVSSNFTLRSFQDEIWRRIGSLDQKWVEKSTEERAQCICDALSRSKFVLFLDDLWWTNLLDLGVPISESKVIFTTRSKDACERYDAATFYMEFLSEEDARSLFWTKVGEELASDPKISDLGEEIIRICARLPLVLCTVGRAMACRKTYEEWYLALQELEICKSMLTTKMISYLLGFCYDSLPNDIVKYCFLYLSLFPEDFKIPKNDLLDFWISEEFFGHLDSSGSALNLGCDVIDTLIRANLFEEENDSVKMLDMIRDFAQSLALQSATLENAQLLNVTSSNNIGRALFMEESIENLPLPDVTPDLLYFFLERNPFIMIKNQFMAELTVLDLSNSCIEEVPRGISGLVSLQHLNLSRTWIEQFPVELKKLVKLKCLNVENNVLLRVIPRQVISSLSSLQVLRMFRCGFSVQDEGDNILSVTNMGINELQSLENLKVLSITITSASALEKFFSNHSLPSCTQALSLEVFWGSKSLNMAPLAAIQNLHTLEIHHAEHLRDVNVNFRMDISFTSLREVNVGKCSNLQDLTWLVLAPNLSIVKVSSCPEMEEIISTRQLAEAQHADKRAFAKLKVLSLESLQNLESIYWKALPFQSLKKVQVFDCPQLHKLPLNANSAKENQVVIEAEEDWWKEVEWEDDATKNRFLSCFKMIDSTSKM